MSKSIFVTIALNNHEREIGSDWEPLKIDGKAIGFLQQPLLNGLKSLAKSGNGCRYWRLRFFDNTEFSVDLLITLSDSEPEHCGEIARAIWQQLNNGSEPTEEQILAASLWLRNAKSLKRDNYEERSNRLICIDGNGLSMFSTALEKATFERAVVLLALACAYRIKIEELVNTLSAWTKDSTDLAALARRACSFNARCYFRHPVQMKYIELPLIWDRLSERFRLNEFDAELTEQTNLLYQLVTDQERAKEQRWWQLVGTILALISAMQVLGLLFQETFNSWGRWIVGLLGVGQ